MTPVEATGAGWRGLHLMTLLCQLGLGSSARRTMAREPASGTSPDRLGLDWGGSLLPDQDLLLPGRPVPLRFGGAPATQVDQTTCGAAVLAVLAALGDPALMDRLCAGDQARRFADLQRTVHRATTRGGPGPPWPRGWGTPPWGAARVAGFAEVRYRSVPFDDADLRQRSVVLGAAGRALDRGIPVPLYTGGDLGLGWGTAVPRHVVLALGRRGPHWWVYEPGGGAVHTVRGTSLEARAAGARDDDVRRALGGWPRLCWALLPRAPGSGGPGPAGGAR